MSIVEIVALVLTVLIMGIVNFSTGFFSVKLKLTETGVIYSGGKFRPGGALKLVGYIMGIGLVLHLINTIIYEAIIIHFSKISPPTGLIHFFIIIIIIVAIFKGFIYYRRHRRRH